MTGHVEIRVAETASEKEAMYRFRYAIYVEEARRYPFDRRPPSPKAR